MNTTDTQINSLIVIPKRVKNPGAMTGMEGRHPHANKLGAGVFRFGQSLTRLHDLHFLNRIRVGNAFYENLRGKLRG